MSKLTEFLKKIKVQDQMIMQLTATDGDADIEQLAKDYTEQREEYYDSVYLTDKVKKESEKTAKGMTLKAIKQMNRTFNFGLTNSQMEEYATIEDFMSFADKTYKDNIAEASKGQNSDFVKQINELRGQVSLKQQELEKVVSEKEAAIKKVIEDKDKEVKTFRAKEVFDRLVKNDTDLPDIPGLTFSIESIRDRIFSDYDVQPDGSVLNKDGTIPAHPDKAKEVVIKNVGELYNYYKGVAGLVKVNNAGSGGGGTPQGGGSGGTQMGAAEKYLLEQLK